MKRQKTKSLTFKTTGEPPWIVPYCDTPNSGALKPLLVSCFKNKVIENGRKFSGVIVFTKSKQQLSLFFQVSPNTVTSGNRGPQNTEQSVHLRFALFVTMTIYDKLKYTHLGTFGRWTKLNDSLRLPRNLLERANRENFDLEMKTLLVHFKYTAGDA